MLLEEVEAVLASGPLVVDACRYVVRDGDAACFADDAPGVVCAGAFARREAGRQTHRATPSLPAHSRAKDADESHRARLRVEARAAAR